MHILLTRQLEDCSEMIVKFKSLGHQVSHLPLLSVEEIVHEKINFVNFNGVIFTSANAVKFINHDEINKTIKCFCVGEATEKKARSFGFQNTIASEGNVSNLKELILQNHDPLNGQLLYVSGEIITVDLDQQLTNEGYSIKRIINYKVNHNQNFKDEFVNKLKQNIPDMVYVYSQNSGSSFLNFIKIHQLESLWMDTNLMCIGEKTSSILNEIKWKKIFLFNPGEEEFLLYKI
jgi:uroporphyrinogen-III synthase